MAWLQAERRVLAALTPQGAPALREAVVGSLARNRGIRADPDEVVVVAGVAQAPALLAPSCGRRACNRIAVEDPGLLGARQQLEYGRPETVPVRAPGEWGRGRPGHPRASVPDRVVPDGERRRDLLGRAGAGGTGHRGRLRREHRYDPAPVSALRALLPEGSAMPGACPSCSPPPCAWAGCWFRPG
ncbi:hypothetical protein [Streptomyces sp. NRRL S-241]|uniref:hypothetical protein n=1 Tax=Streptomyces sp. NRRL S-241 TaxID=1463896 RepID=UPI000ABA1145